MPKTALKQAAIGVSLARAGFGLAMIIAPERIAESWIGDAGRSVRVSVLTRSLGARDIALGGGAALSLLRGDDDAARVWLATQAFSDLVDLAGTLAARDRLPDSGVKATSALAGGSALIAGGAAATLG
jgi:hypothetical protein